MKKNRTISFKKICYILLIISALCGAVTVFSFANEIKENYVNNEKKIVYSSACVGRAYFEEIFKECTSSLEILAERLAGSDLSNRNEIGAACKKLDMYFDDISLLDIKGIRLYGNCLYNRVYNSNGFKKAIKKKSNVATEVTLNYVGTEELCIFVPVIVGDRVQAVLVGSMLLSDLSNRLYNSGLAKNGYVVIVSDSGDIIAGTRNICDIGLSGNTNLFSYVNECKVYDGVNNSKLRSNIRDCIETDYQYTYNNRNYIVTTLPTSLNSWSFMYVSKGKRENLSDIFITSKSMNFFKILCFAMLVMALLFVYTLRSREKLLKIQKTYDEVSRIDKTIIFKYNFMPKKFVFKDKFEDIVEKHHKPLMGEAVYDVYEYIHPDDLSIRSRLRKFFESKEDFFTSEVRVKNRDGQYNWYRISGFLEREENGAAKCFVGKLSDASKQISMEKNLVQRAENDLLTGVLNKKTIEEKMSMLLSERKSDRYYIFYMIDLDNFKNVNDTLGHIYGDKAIADTGAVLSDIFKNDALIGRLGGDEFAVCSMYDAFDDESLKNYIIKKAEQIGKANRRSYTDGVNVVNITSSIGISIAPKDGNDFETVYKKADSALYQSKKTGKDRYTLYNGELWEK